MGLRVEGSVSACPARIVRLEWFGVWGLGFSSLGPCNDYLYYFGGLLVMITPKPYSNYSGP